MHLDILVLDFMKTFILLFDFHWQCLTNVLMSVFFQLLVNNKIISLDLSVAEVYKKVWCPTNEVRVLIDSQ